MIRRDMITASVAGDIIRRKKEYGPLVQRLQSTRKVVTSSMRHGIACEPVAANAYVDNMNRDVNIYPCGLVVNPCGLVVNPWSPWLAATPGVLLNNESKIWTPGDQMSGESTVRVPIPQQG